MNITSHFGRGVKFNGIDQTINGGTWQELGISGNDVQQLTMFVNIIEGEGIALNTGYTSQNGGFSIGTTGTRIYVAANGTGGDNSVFYIDKSHGVIAVTFDDNLFSIYVNGVLEGSRLFSYPVAPLTFSSVGNLSIGSYRLTSSFASNTINNVIMFKQLMTPEQIKYQFQRPETFIYREYGLIKSKILNQVELDNTVAFLPLCESDRFTRELINYSETEKSDGVLTTINQVTTWPVTADISDAATVIDTSTLHEGLQTVKITSVGSTTVASILSDRIIELKVSDSVTSTLFQGDVFKVRFSIKSVNAPDAVRFTTTTSKVVSNNPYLTLTSRDGDWRTYEGVVSLDMQSVATGFYVIMATYYDVTTAIDTWHGNDFEFIKLTGTKEITGYVDEINTKNINLSTGLQTSKWKRDPFGLPLSLAEDSLECDLTGYLDTNWEPPENGKYSIEAVIYLDKDSPVNITTGSNSVRFVYYTNNTFLVYGSKSRDYCSSPQLSFNAYNHVIATFDEGEVTLYVNNQTTVFKQPQAFRATTETFKIGVGAGLLWNLPIRSFKVYDKLVSPQEIEYKYNDILRSGYLRDDIPDNVLLDVDGNVVLDAEGNYILVS